MKMEFYTIIILVCAALQTTAVLACKSGWKSFGYQCYYISHIKKSWNDAEAYCRHIGGSLVEIDSAPENHFIQSHLTPGRNYFIGASCLASHGTWRWQYSKGLVNSGYNNWYPGQPDNYSGHQWCVVLWENHHWTWNDQSCTDPEGFVCES